MDTTPHWSKNAEEACVNRRICISRISRETLENSNVNWDRLYSGDSGSKALNSAKTPLEHQIEAVKKAREYFIEQNNSRGKLIMACGTGKTYTSLKIVEKITNGKGNIHR